MKSSKQFKLSFLHQSCTWIVGLVAVISALVTLNSIGRWYRSELGGEFADWISLLHATLVVAIGIGLYYVHTGRGSIGNLTLLCALSLLLSSFAWLMSPENVFERAMRNTLTAEYALADSNSPEWLVDQSPAAREKMKQWLVEELSIRRAEEAAAQLSYQRAKRQNESFSLLGMWAVLCAGVTLLYCWKPTACNQITN